MYGERVHLVVAGRVQGVGFRYATRVTATSLGVGGWVRNTADGRVEIRAEGPCDKIETLLQWCKAGPPLAEVSEVKILQRQPLGTPAESVFLIHHDDK